MLLEHLAEQDNPLHHRRMADRVNLLLGGDISVVRSSCFRLAGCIMAFIVTLVLVLWFSVCFGLGCIVRIRCVVALARTLAQIIFFCRNALDFISTNISPV